MMRQSRSSASIVSSYRTLMRLVYDAALARPSLFRTSKARRSTSTTTWWQWCWGTARSACGASRRPSASSASCAPKASACGGTAVAALPPNAHVPRAARRLPVRRPRAPRPRQSATGAARSGRRRAIASPVAAHVRADQVDAVGRVARRNGAAGCRSDIATVDARRRRAGLRSRTEEARSSFRPPGHAERRAALERLTFSGAYKGVTDLVTKWLWPVPAQWVTRGCVRIGMTPNQVTAASLVLVIVAGVLFARGEFGWGLVAGWIMTFLDTVDGKLARVTITSTKLGNVFDHGIDLVHPPFWYLAWGIGLALEPPAIAGMPLTLLYAVILAGYVGGRLCEGAFQLFIARFSIFTWRPFDSWFRLIAARRNPNMIALTVSLALGRPDLGLARGRRVDRAVDGAAAAAPAAGRAGEASAARRSGRGSPRSARRWTSGTSRCASSPTPLPPRARRDAAMHAGDTRRRSRPLGALDRRAAQSGERREPARRRGDAPRARRPSGHSLPRRRSDPASVTRALARARAARCRHDRDQRRRRHRARRPRHRASARARSRACRGSPCCAAAPPT